MRLSQTMICRPDLLLYECAARSAGTRCHRVYLDHIGVHIQHDTAKCLYLLSLESNHQHSLHQFKLDGNVSEAGTDFSGQRKTCQWTKQFSAGLTESAFVFSIKLYKLGGVTRLSREDTIKEGLSSHPAW